MTADLNPVSLAFDGLLCIALLFSAWQVMTSADLFRAIVLFFVFGLLMSLAWVRLNAVDVALAEAAIGAGLTGTLFVAAWARVRRTAPRLDGRTEEEARPTPPPPSPGPGKE